MIEGNQIDLNVIINILSPTPTILLVGPLHQFYLH